jgi:hypothetical protein
MPDGRISQVRFETLTFFCRSSPRLLGLSAGSHTPELPLVHLQPRSIAYVRFCRLCVQPFAAFGTAKVQSPFALPRRYRGSRDMNCLLGGHYSSVFAPTGSCASAVASPFLQPSGLVRGVSAGCYQPLLPTAPSRRYFLRFFLRMPEPLPRRSHGVHLPGSSSVSSAFPTWRRVGFSRFIPRTRLFTGNFSELQLFRYVQASAFACLPGRSYRCQSPSRAAEAFTSEQNVRRYLRTHRICYRSNYRQLTERGLSPARFAVLSTSPSTGITPLPRSYEAVRP